MSNLLGGKGIFVCDDCRGNLNIEIQKEQFEELKNRLNSNKDSMHKCYLCNQFKHSNDGVKISPEYMANAIEGTLERSDMLYNEFKKGRLTCTNCAKKINFKGKEIICPYCSAEINTKKYGKSIKMPMSKKVTFKLYIKYLRKQNGSN